MTKPLAVVVGDDGQLKSMMRSLDGPACDVACLTPDEADRQLPDLLRGRTRVLAVYLVLRPSRAFLDSLFAQEPARRLWGALVYCNMTPNQAAMLVRGFVDAAHQARRMGS